MRLKRAFLILLFVIILLPALVYFGVVCPMPIDYLLNTESSPDGRLSASYSWRPAGLFGAAIGDQPWLYLTVRERDSGRVVARHSIWGDTSELSEAQERLSRHRPW